MAHFQAENEHIGVHFHGPLVLAQAWRGWLTCHPRASPATTAENQHPATGPLPFSQNLLELQPPHEDGHAGLDGEGLFREYVSKNVLNHFRQDNGYKTGTYQKTWGGQEDNVHLVALMEQG